MQIKIRYIYIYIESGSRYFVSHFTKGSYQKINKLTFIEESISRYRGFVKIKYGMFECECGNTKDILIHNVVAGNTKSCGCNSKLRWRNKKLK